MTTAGWVLLFIGTGMHWVAVRQDSKKIRHGIDLVGSVICALAWIFIGIYPMCGLSFLLLSGHLSQVMQAGPVIDRLEAIIHRPAVEEIDRLAEEVEG